VQVQSAPTELLVDIARVERKPPVQKVISPFDTVDFMSSEVYPYNANGLRVFLVCRRIRDLELFYERLNAVSRKFCSKGLESGEQGSKYFLGKTLLRDRSKFD